MSWGQPPNAAGGPPGGYQPVQTIIAAPPTGPGCLIRAIWFIFIGSWLTGFVIGIAYFAALTIIGLPLAFYLFNRIPTILTLRGRSMTYVTTRTMDGRTYTTRTHAEQHPMYIRAIWFVCVGWWLGALWMGLAYVLCLTIIGLPIGIMMFDRIGGVMTLLRY